MQWRVRVLQAGSLPTGQSGVTLTPPGPQSSLVCYQPRNIHTRPSPHHTLPQHDQTTGGAEAEQVRDKTCDGTWLMLITYLIMLNRS